MRNRVLPWSIAVIVLAVVVGVVSPKEPKDLPGDYDSPIVAVYMAKTLPEVEKLVPSEQLRHIWNKFLVVDVVFLIAYGWMFFSMAKLMQQKTSKLDRTAGKLALIASPLTAVADLGENFAIYQALAGSAEWATWIHRSSLTKWALLGLTALLISRLFSTKLPVDTEGKLFCLGASFFYVVTAVITAFGIWQYPILERVIPALGVAVLLHSWVAWRFPQSPFDSSPRTKPVVYERVVSDETTMQ